MVKCFTCENTHHWKDMDAGHYHAGSTSLSLFFDEKNVHPQCSGCNRFRHGNLTNYALALKKKYGESILEDLQIRKHLIDKITKSQYEEKIQEYKEKLKDIEL